MIFTLLMNITFSPLSILWLLASVTPFNHAVCVEADYYSSQNSFSVYSRSRAIIPWNCLFGYSGVRKPPVQHKGNRHSGRLETVWIVFCKHLMPKVACEKCTKVHVHFVHYCSGRAAGQATANISVISYFKIFLLSLRCVPLHYRTHLCLIL